MPPDDSSGNGDLDSADLDSANPVHDEVWLYRLIPVTLCEAVDGEWQFRSGAFGNSTEPGFETEMSIVLDDTLSEHARRPEDLPEFSFPDEADQWGVAKLKTDCARAISEQEVVRSPNADEPAHGDVLGVKNTKRRKRFKKCATWVIEPATPPT